MRSRTRCASWAATTMSVWSTTRPRRFPAITTAMGITEMTCGKGKYGLRPQALAVLALLTTQAAPVLAAEWRFTPELTLRETYSDNITLAPSGSEQSGFVTEIAPGFTITGKGRRSQLRATYQARSINYSN